jgi:zinc protease
MKIIIRRYLSVFLLLTIFFTVSEVVNAQLNHIKYFKDYLDNGLEVIYCEDKSVPIVATVMHYRVGSKDEISTQAGFAHFFEHLMFESTENIPRSSIDKYIQQAGGQLNAATSFDYTSYYFKVPSNQVNLALWIESERMRKLKVEAEGVETQRGVVLEEIKQRNTNKAYGSLLQKTMENLFHGTSYAWSVIGHEKNIIAATIDDFKNFYNKHYQPNNATLVVVGDFDGPGARKLIEKYFGKYKRGPEIKRTDMSIPPMKKQYREIIEDDKAKLPGIFISYRGPSFSDSSYYAMSLLIDILASGESSRLYQRLVDKEQLAVDASVMSLPLKYSGLIMFSGIADSDKNINDIEKIINEEISNVIINGVTGVELQKAKNIKESEFILANKNVLTKAKALAKYNYYFNDPGLINTETERYSEVTIDDIKKAAARFFNTNKNVTLIYKPKEK